MLKFFQKFDTQKNFKNFSKEYRHVRLVRAIVEKIFKNLKNVLTLIRLNLKTIFRTYQKILNLFLKSKKFLKRFSLYQENSALIYVISLFELILIIKLLAGTLVTVFSSAPLLPRSLGARPSLCVSMHAMFLSVNLHCTVYEYITNYTLYSVR